MNFHSVVCSSGVVVVLCTTSASCWTEEGVMISLVGLRD